MHVRTGNYGPDFGHRPEKKARFPANSTRVQRPIDAGAELIPVWSIEGREKKVHSDFASVEQKFKSRFQGEKSKVFTVKTRTEKLSTNTDPRPKQTRLRGEMHWQMF